MERQGQGNPPPAPGRRVSFLSSPLGFHPVSAPHGQPLGPLLSWDHESTGLESDTQDPRQEQVGHNKGRGEPQSKTLPSGLMHRAVFSCGFAC